MVRGSSAVVGMMWEVGGGVLDEVEQREFDCELVGEEVVAVVAVVAVQAAAIVHAEGGEAGLHSWRFQPEMKPNFALCLQPAVALPLFA